MIQILNATKEPIKFMGEVAGICYNSNTESAELNYKRGLRNIKDNHGRVFEFADVTMLLDGYSARVMREVYTHIIGTSRVQASTRYIDYDGFEFYTPKALEGNDSYKNIMDDINYVYKKLLDEGYKKEDIGNILPLGMNSKMVLKINYRALLHMAEVRMCSRAYIEFQDLMKDIIAALSEIDDEWKYLAGLMKPRCESCTEQENCEL